MKSVIDGAETRKAKWEREVLEPTLKKSPERTGPFTTISGRPIERLYTAEDVAGIDEAVGAVRSGGRPKCAGERHDAVRSGADAAIPGVAVADTVKQIDAAGNVVHTPDRSTLAAVQTPQAFRASVLRAAHASGADATDDAALVEARGGRVVVVAGDPRNRKITDPADLAWARDQLGGGAVRVGQGFDIHRFSDDPARPLVLGGVVFEGTPGLHGHSDADAIAHAVTDALLGAAGLGDKIGRAHV